MHWSCITRKWNCRNKYLANTAVSLKADLQKKELALNEKEKKLLKKEKVLQKKIREYKHHRNRRAKSDLRAAKKLKRARKKLVSVLDSKDRLKFRKKKHTVKNTRNKIKKRKSKPKRKGDKGFIDTLTEFPAQCFNDLLNKPCYCNPGRVRRRRIGEEEPSLLRILCGGPCGCSPAPGRKYTDRHKKKLGMQLCRCEIRDRNRYGAGDCYLMSLRQTPQVWIRHRWPRFYPHYLDARHQWKNLSHCLLLCAGILVWTPCIICLELCKCFCCACCSD